MSATPAVMANAKERPILFRGSMVRAILDGKKTQTRRVMKPQPTLIDSHDQTFYWEGWSWQHRSDVTNVIEDCPYGVPGDRLWVRETWIPVRHGSYEALDPHQKPRSECDAVIEFAASAHSGYHKAWDSYPGQWRPSIFMPRWASRITLEITGVRVERVQSIIPSEALAEGVEDATIRGLGDVAGYKALWDSINAKRGFGWDANPWVWVVEFKRVSA